jgi:hypothetical protein
MKNIRHGDLALIGVEKLPEGLKETKTKILIRGSNNNPHSINQGKVYLYDKPRDFVIGYLVAEETKLLHCEHGISCGKGKIREVKIPDGVYELHCQKEFTHEGMRRVAD